MNKYIKIHCETFFERRKLMPNIKVNPEDIVTKKIKTNAEPPKVDMPGCENPDIVTEKAKVKANNEPDMANTNYTVDPNAPGYAPKQ